MARADNFWFVEVSRKQGETLAEFRRTREEQKAQLDEFNRKIPEGTPDANGSLVPPPAQTKGS